jgi:pilus assembly protein Flp/PilA
MEKLKRFFKGQEGATAIEYALIVALIAIVIVGAVTAIGTALQNPFNTVAGAL